MLSEAKSSIFFSENTAVEMKAEVCEILNILTESLIDKYLGLPALIGADRSKNLRMAGETFEYGWEGGID